MNDDFDEDRIVRTAISEGRTFGAKSVLVCGNCATATYFYGDEAPTVCCPVCRHEGVRDDLHAI